MNVVLFHTVIPDQDCSCSNHDRVIWQWADLIVLASRAMELPDWDGRLTKDAAETVHLASQCSLPHAVRVSDTLEYSLQPCKG